MRTALRLPIVVLVLVLLVALAATGLVYGLWAKTLTIEGEVETGYLHAKWVDVDPQAGQGPAFCTEYHFDEGGQFRLGEYEGKDVGDFTVGRDPADDNRLLFEAWNTYPSYRVDCQVHFTNDGTIPWKIRGFRLVPLQNLTSCVEAGGLQSPRLECAELTVQFINGLGSQYEPGDMAAESLQFHVEQPADMLTTYKFAVDICVGQWNEEVDGAACFAASP